MTPELHRRTGFEIELLAPAGRSRLALAQDLAARCGGQVRPVWHHDSEPSLVPEVGRFRHLTQGFEVRRADGSPLCTLVDDVTLLADVDPRVPPAPGWFRILTDDPRILRLIALHTDPGVTVDTALDAAAELWHTTVSRHDGIVVLDDERDVTIALAAPQGGERERPCEIITPPLTTGHHAALEELLGPAREMGFTVPQEAAVHLHVDGGPFRGPRALANLVRLFAHWRDPLRTVLQTNPNCRRLAPLPDPLVKVADGDEPTIAALRRAADEGELSKYFDVNLTQVLTDTPRRDTVEVRILPGAITADEILARAGLVELLLDRCATDAPFPYPPGDPAAAAESLLHLAASTLGDR
ncbi:amidoligase family protein [Actinoplanes sp. NPDC049265]|uniref:amidoligase family protein n=1 Tax=Actinoplanes sp. NPDC049265 TaxID=3363902 RepID=UPI003719821D